jgi:hypothetical protein
MNHKTRDFGRKTSSSAQSDAPFIWPLGKSPTTPDEMNTSFGPRIDADRWDFHDGIDLPAAVGTPVHAMADGVVHRAGPADKIGPGQGFGSTHVLLRVYDPTDKKNDLFLVYLHLDSITEGIIAGAPVHKGDVIGAVGQEDATYPHLHFEFRKGQPRADNSVHPLRYLPYLNTANFRQLRLDRSNFYRNDNGDKRLVRLTFAVRNRREGDFHAVHVELTGSGVTTRELHVDFDDRHTINIAKGDVQAFKKGIAVEGYQKSNMKAEGLNDVHYGVLIKDITSEYESVTLRIQDVKNEKPKGAEFTLPKLEVGKQPVNRRVDFEGQAFPPEGWKLHLLPGNVCRPDPAAALTDSDSRSLLCHDFESEGTLIRAGLSFSLPVGRMSWRLGADIKLAELEIDEGQVIYPLAFLAGNDLVAAACVRKISNDKFVTGVLMRSADGLFRERIDVNEGQVSQDVPFSWQLGLLRLGTRQTTAVVRLNNKVMARINGDTTSVEPDTGCVGILHKHSELQITLHIDRLVMTEAPS